MLISDYLSSNKLHSFFDLTHFKELRQKYKNIFVWFFVQMKTSKFAFEINWPLENIIIVWFWHYFLIFFRIFRRGDSNHWQNIKIWPTTQCPLQAWTQPVVKIKTRIRQNQCFSNSGQTYKVFKRLGSETVCSAAYSC